MFYKDEEIREEIREEELKDSEYFKRKRNRRRMYRKKSFLIMKDSESSEAPIEVSKAVGDSSDSKSNLNSTKPPNGGIRFVGQVCNMSLATDLDQGRIAPMRSDSNANSFPFKYVLLQFTKRPSEVEGGATTNEINVIPVNDMFLFKKGLGGKDELLTEIEEKFELQNQQKRAQFAHYKGIFRSLKDYEAKKLQEADDDDDDYIGGFDSASLFGNAVSKALSGSKKSGSKSNKFKRESGHKHHIEHIDENGVQLDELNEYNEWCKGDYETKFADDEENNVELEQATLNEMEDLEVSRSLHIDDTEEGAAGAAGANNDLDEEEEEEAGEDIRREAEEKEREAVENSSGLVDEAIMSSAVEARSVLMHLQHHKAAALEAQDRAIQPLAGGFSTVPTSSTSEATSAAAAAAKPSLKRPRPDEGTEKQSRSVSFAAESVEEVGSVKADINVKASGEYELSEEGIRRYIENKGGRVATRDVLEVLFSLNAFLVLFGVAFEMC